MTNPVVSWAKENPLAAGAAAVGVIVVVMMVSGGGSGDASAAEANNGAGVAAYYSAVANQSQAGAAVQIAEVQANAATNQTLIAASYGLEKEKIWGASTDLATGANKELSMAAIHSNEIVEIEKQKSYNNGINLANQALSQKNLGPEQRGAIVQTAITGVNAPVTYKPINPGNSASAIIGSVGSAVGSIAKGIGSLF